MMDHFAALGIARAPRVDAEVLKAHFHRRGAETHPDAGGSAEEFARVNSAWQCLRSASGCLRHFLELEHPHAHGTAQTAPAELGDLFMEIADIRQQAAQLASRLAAAAPIARALLEPERLRLRDRLTACEAAVAAQVSLALALAESSRDPAVLAAVLGRLGYLEKWAAQLREAAE